MNKKLFLCIKIAISLLLIYFVFTKVDISEVLASWSNFSLGAIVTVLILHFSALLINTIKWKLFLPEQTFRRLFQFTFIDVFYGMALPGQVSGEVAKAYRLGKRTGDMRKVAVSVWMDKLTGIIGLVFLVLIGFIFSTRSFPAYFYIITAVLFIGGVLSIYVFNFSLLSTFLEKYLSWKLIGTILSSIKDFKKDHRVIFSNIILGALYQALSIMITMVFAHELGIEISIIDWFWIFGLISIIQFIPISIAGLGVREASFVGILSLFLIPTGAAVTLSLSIFGIQLIFAIAGFLFESHYNLSHR